MSLANDLLARAEPDTKMSKVELLSPQQQHQQQQHQQQQQQSFDPHQKQEAEAGREDDCASPPRMNIKEEDSSTDCKDKIESDNGYHVAESIKNSFRDPHHFQMIRNMIEGVSKNTSKAVLGEAVNDSKEWDDDDQCDESIASEDGQMNSGQDDRKVRVRTLISEEQSLVLKTHYQMNPRPKREELDGIAKKIGHPFKVVKVWFQNARARDRREGKNLPHLPFPGSPAHPPFLNNNFQFSNLPRLSAALPFMRPGSGLPEHLTKLNTLFPFTSLPGFSLRDDSKSPDSVKSDNIDDEMEEDDDVEAPLDLSNKGSTPGASPAADKEDQFSRQSINFSKLGASFSSSDEETDSADKKNSLNKHLLDHKGSIT